MCLAPYFSEHEEAARGPVRAALKARKSYHLALHANRDAQSGLDHRHLALHDWIVKRPGRFESDSSCDLEQIELHFDTDLVDVDLEEQCDCERSLSSEFLTRR